MSHILNINSRILVSYLLDTNRDSFGLRHFGIHLSTQISIFWTIILIIIILFIQQTDFLPEGILFSSRIFPKCCFCNIGFIIRYTVLHFTNDFSALTSSYNWFFSFRKFSIDSIFFRHPKDMRASISTYSQLLHCGNPCTISPSGKSCTVR